MTRCLAAFLLSLTFFSANAVADEPVVPDSTPEAKKILDYLSRLPTRFDRRVVAGQHAGMGEEAVRLLPDQLARLRALSSKRIAMICADYGYAGDAPLSVPVPDRSVLNRLLIGHWKSGGLVMLRFGARNPWTGGSARDTTAHEMRELITPGTTANAAWTKELESAADALAELRDAGVPVLWCPFYDMNGGGNWWGKRESAEFDKGPFVDLWVHMFDYFGRTRRLNNLLWVYSASSDAHKKTSASAYFPGKEYCDLVGLSSSSSEAVWDGYNEMFRLGKPFGVTEVSTAPGRPEAPDYGKVLANIKLWYPLTAFLVAGPGPAALENAAGGPALLKDPWLISMDDLDWAAPGHRRWRQSEKLALGKVEVLTREAVCWKRVDLRIEVAAAFDTPFDPDQIEVDGTFKTPSGRLMKVPAFFDQPFERQVWGNGRFSEETLSESGSPEWRIRFMPSEPGSYHFSVRARDRSGSVESGSLAFTVLAAAGPGFVRVSSKDARYFEFDNGEVYFPIGMNVVEHPLSEYYRYIPRLAGSGANFSRLWIGFDYFALEYGTLGDYRLDNAWRLDQVMELSERHGIYQKLCVDWVRYITRRGEPRNDFDREDYAYSVSNGGPCRNMKDFFSLPEARRLFKNRLRYIVARWGYSPNVMAWELWNEIDLVDPDARNADILRSWNQEMCRYLKAIDPWQHLTTNSLAGRELGKILWPLEENQFAQRHGYAVPRPEAVLASADMAGNVLRWLDDVSSYSKPYLMSEFGLQRDRMEIRAVCDRDQEGVHMHDGMWAALVHGAAGTAQLWWWGQYVDPKNLYVHFRSVANFVKDIPFTSAGFVPVQVDSTPENLRMLGLRGRDFSIFWLQNRAHTWWNVINRVSFPPVEATEVAIPGFAPGRYRVEYWDTYEGRLSRSAGIAVIDGTLKLPVPKLETDIAVKIIRGEAGTLR